MNYRIAAGSDDGIYVTEHFGRCRQVMIFETSQETEAVNLVETRVLPLGCGSGCGSGHDPGAIAEKIDALSDCRIVLMARIGGPSEKQLIHRGLIALQFEGRLDEALQRIRKAYRARVFEPIA